MKILIGVHCNDKKSEVVASLTLRTELHLLAYHMHQPALDAAGVLAKVNSHEILKKPEKTITPWQQSAAELQIGIRKLLLAGNPTAFVDNATVWLNNSTNSPLRNMFNGYIFYGIDSEQEADFIRQNNGMLIHVINVNNPRKIEIAQSEIATYFSDPEEPSRVSLLTIAKCVREHFAMQSPEAA